MFDFAEFEVKGNVCRTYEDDSEDDPEDQVAGEDLLPMQNEAPDQDDAEDELFDGMLKIVKCSVNISLCVLDGIDVCSVLVIAIILVLMFFLIIYYLELYTGK